MAYHLDHAADLWPVGLHDAFADPVQPKRAQRLALRLVPPIFDLVWVIFRSAIECSR